jgi:hypothetical protein
MMSEPTKENFDKLSAAYMQMNWVYDMMPRRTMDEERLNAEWTRIKKETDAANVDFNAKNLSRDAEEMKRTRDEAFTKWRQAFLEKEELDVEASRCSMEIILLEEKCGVKRDEKEKKKDGK